MTIILFITILLNLTVIQYLSYAALMLLFADVDSQKRYIKRYNKVHNNMCVMIKKNVQSEIPLCE